MVSDAIASGNVNAINYFVAQKYIEAFKSLAEAPNQKFVLMPMESSGILGSLGGIAELAKLAAKGRGQRRALRDRARYRRRGESSAHLVKQSGDFGHVHDWLLNWAVSLAGARRRS